MGRWFVILSLAVMQCPDIAKASPKSSDVPLWKRLLSAFTPAPQPAHNAQAQPSRAATTSSSSAPAGAPEVHEATKSTGADAGCSGGHRVISAFYWQGERTASGQPFNPQGMTAAHRTLPFGTRLTVTNPRTGKSVTVVVNDRGPFISGVSLDLSLGAAQAIGMHGTGAVCIW
jgi:rare lipoprotein A